MMWPKQPWRQQLLQQLPMQLLHILTSLRTVRRGDALYGTQARAKRVISLGAATAAVSRRPLPPIDSSNVVVVVVVVVCVCVWGGGGGGGGAE